MKIRNSFVSNSSSSSFLVVGIALDNKEELFKKFPEFEKLVDENEDEYLDELCSQYFDPLGLDCIFDEDQTEFVVGVHLGSTYNSGSNVISFEIVEEKRKKSAEALTKFGVGKNDIELCAMGSN